MEHHHFCRYLSHRTTIYRGHRFHTYVKSLLFFCWQKTIYCWRMAQVTTTRRTRMRHRISHGAWVFHDGPWRRVEELEKSLEWTVLKGRIILQSDLKITHEIFETSHFWSFWICKISVVPFLNGLIPSYFDPSIICRGRQGRHQNTCNACWSMAWMAGTCRRHRLRKGICWWN